jgi:hypothetical protein
MRLKTILNKCCKFKSIIFTKAQFNEKSTSIIITVKRQLKIPLTTIKNTHGTANVFLASHLLFLVDYLID